MVLMSRWVRAHSKDAIVLLFWMGVVGCREAARFSGRKGGELVKSSVSGFPGMAAIMICDGYYTAFPNGSGAGEGVVIV